MSEDIPQDVSGQKPELGVPVDEQHLSYPYRYSMEQFEAPVGAHVTEVERTTEGYTELQWQYREVQRALALDFDHHTASTMTRAELLAAAQPQLDEMNQKRGEAGATPLNPGELNPRFLSHLVRPDWQAHMPMDDSEASETGWEQFKAKFPEHIQINLDDLRELDGKMRVLSGDRELQSAVQEIHESRLEVMRTASAFIGADRKIDALTRRAALVYQNAGVSNRSLTVGEERHIERLQLQQAHIRENRGSLITSPDMMSKLKVELRRRTDIDRRRDFEKGLVMTDSMKKIIDELLPSLAQGRPALLVGETGGAKTALAEYTSEVYFGKEPEFISGYGDVNSYQVMGKMNLKSKDGATISDFAPGPVVRAMEAGVPLILDEINAMPPEFLKRLNKIVQMRPGDTFVVQEDSGREVTIKPGFVIIATANEKSKRYKGIEDLSVEFQNRFGANVIRVHYPDHEVVFGEAPVENAILARAALTDRAGALVGGIEPEELERFVRACHVTQQVFSGNFGQGFRDFVSSERIADNKPGLDEAVLAPRTMVALLEKVRDSYGKVSLEQVLHRFVTGIKSGSDKKQMATILQGYGFLKQQKD